MKTLSVVCARKGSKGLDHKCTAMIGNKMVIEYSIEYSLSLGDSVKTVVSTDIDEVLHYCDNRQVESIQRDKRLCEDDTPIQDVLADAIEKCGAGYELCSLVYGNVPVRYSDLFWKAYDFLKENTHFDAALSMQNVEKYNPAWMFEYNEIQLPYKKMVHYRRQELPQMMIHDSHTVVFRSEGFYGRYKGEISYKNKYIYSMYGGKIKPLINNKLIIDIDTEKDLRLAEAVIINLKEVHY